MFESKKQMSNIGHAFGNVSDVPNFFLCRGRRSQILNNFFAI